MTQTEMQELSIKKILQLQCYMSVEMRKFTCEKQDIHTVDINHNMKMIHHN